MLIPNVAQEFERVSQDAIRRGHSDTSVTLQSLYPGLGINCHSYGIVTMALALAV